jgi:hypothetical protein
MAATPGSPAEERPQTVQSVKEAADSPATDEKRGSGTLWRRGVAVVIAFGGLAIFLASIWKPEVQVCKETAGGTSYTNTTSCNPWGLSELLPLLLLAAIFVLPDFSELSVFNLVTFKRELKAQKQELDATAARQTALESQVVGQLAQLNSVQSVNVHYVDPAHLSEAIQEKNETGQRYTRRPDRETSVYGGARAAVAMDLLAEWELLAERLGLGRLRDQATLDEEIRGFRLLFRDEIDTVRRVRNSVAHNVYVDDAVLENALAGVRELNSILPRKS